MARARGDQTIPSPSFSLHMCEEDPIPVLEGQKYYNTLNTQGRGGGSKRAALGML